MGFLFDWWILIVFCILAFINRQQTSHYKNYKLVQSLPLSLSCFLCIKLWVVKVISLLKKHGLLPEYLSFRWPEFWVWAGAAVSFFLLQAWKSGWHVFRQQHGMNLMYFTSTLSASKVFLTLCYHFLDFFTFSRIKLCCSCLDRDEWFVLFLCSLCFLY